MSQLQRNHMTYMIFGINGVYLFVRDVDIRVCLMDRDTVHI